MQSQQKELGSFSRPGADSAYDEAIQFLYSQLPMFSRVGAAAYKPGLDTTLELDRIFGHPHTKFKSIHIGGTNGKGSTSHTLAAMLQAQGYKVGLYTSPHLVDFRERIRVNGEMIPRSAVTDFVQRWKSVRSDGLHPSFFELTMMMAFDWFAQQNVDYAVIEVGMGGRLDSTNIITPIACVITNISPDHTQFLGTTLPAIASEKAGIIKSDIPVVIGEAEGEVRQVFEQRAAEVGTDITFASDEALLLSAHETEPAGLECEAVSPGKFRFALSGDYQIANANTLLSAVSMLRRCGVRLDDEAVKRGFAEVESLTGLRGRWTIISNCPLSICDTGHNEAGLCYNMNQLERLISRRHDARLRIVAGFVADKAIDHILPLLPSNALYYITQAAIPRALPAEELYKLATASGLDCRLCPTPVEAWHTAMTEAASDDIIYVGGSTFVVADLLAWLDSGGQLAD
ncbi:MAG: bifunctional folylpolyglutamate synthase/dihydrofolate synthase [Muribaculaceae bacterium]|nr:bifunctional folylpolyglutamate synthase/dihydrofolate synthase [Muribaculaceae bacterium]